MSLRELQEAFLKTFYQPDAEDYLRHIRVAPGMNSRERFEIYEGSITQGLLQGLRGVFPVTEKLVGEDFFRAMGYRFAAEKTSESPNIHDYGGSFADFVAQFPPAQSLPYLADVCRLEWAWHQAYSGPDHHSIDVHALTKMSPEQHELLVFQRSLNSTLVGSLYPIHEIWRINQDDDNDHTVDLAAGGVRLIVWRPSMEVLIETLTDAQWLILTAFDEGISLGEMTGSMFDDKIDLNKEIPQIVSRGWISDWRKK